MGYGDELMASGLARGAMARGKRVAFGDGKRVIWHHFARQIHRHNPNIIEPGFEGGSDVEWISHYPGSRPYVRHQEDRCHWVKGWADRPGEVFLTDEEIRFAEKQGEDFVVIEPNVPSFKTVAPNKQWPHARYEEVARQCPREVVQFTYGHPYHATFKIRGARQISAPSFRHALAVLGQASLFVGPEGGLHHGCAARKRHLDGSYHSKRTHAIVLYGGFLSPEITGYSDQVGLTAGGEPCGSLRPCRHCAEAMASISVETVTTAMLDFFRKTEAA